MGIDFYGKNGKTFYRNVAAGTWLAKITFGLFEQIGCYPKSEEDCKLVARILKNRANLNQYHTDYWTHEYCVKKETKHMETWMLELAEFFDTCGGCYEEGEFYKKYPIEDDS
jgi:hypothetical protein